MTENKKPYWAGKDWEIETYAMRVTDRVLQQKTQTLRVACLVEELTRYITTGDLDIIDRVLLRLIHTYALGAAEKLCLILVTEPIKDRLPTRNRVLDYFAGDISAPRLFERSPEYDGPCAVMVRCPHRLNGTSPVQCEKMTGHLGKHLGVAAKEGERTTTIAWGIDPADGG
jgi:hypothetical protein